MAYDVIGDIHGHADALCHLLRKLGYREIGGTYRHPDRTAVFVGDFIDRGPQQREAIRVVRAMMEYGSAKAVMGNHEFNAIGWATPDGQGGHLRPHDYKNNRAQHQGFLDQLGEASDEYWSAISWFRSLPLWLDLGRIRVVHACWHEPSRALLQATCLDAGNRFTEEGFHLANADRTDDNRAAEIILKGPEIALPPPHNFVDKDGHVRREARLRWWDGTALTYRTAVLGMDGREDHLPDAPIPSGFGYDHPTPVLFGHYWMQGEPVLTSPTAACLDFSIAKGGVLAAYRWSGEEALNRHNLLFVAGR